MADEKQLQSQHGADEEPELDAAHVIWERKRFYCCFGWQRPAIHSGWKSDAGRRLKERHQHPSTKEYRKAMAGDAKAMQDWDWKILVNEHTDAQGWQYARCVWLKLGTFRLGGRSQERLLDCVRRRQWVHEDYVDEVLGAAKGGTVSLLDPVQLAQQAREEKARYEEGVKAVWDLLAQLQHSKRIKSMAYALLDPVAVRAVSQQHVKSLKALQLQAFEDLHEATIAPEEVWGDIPRVMQPTLQLRHALRSGVNHLMHDVKQGMHDIRHGVGQLLQQTTLHLPGRSLILGSQQQQQQQQQQGPSAFRRVIQLALPGSNNPSPDHSVARQVVPTSHPTSTSVTHTAIDAELAALKVPSLTVGSGEAAAVTGQGFVVGVVAGDSAAAGKQGVLPTLQEDASAHWNLSSPFQHSPCSDTKPNTAYAGDGVPASAAQQLLVSVVTDMPAQVSTVVVTPVAERVTRRAASIDETRNSLPAAAAACVLLGLDTEVAGNVLATTAAPDTQPALPSGVTAQGRPTLITRGFSLPHPALNRPSSPKSVTSGARDDNSLGLPPARALQPQTPEQPALLGRLVNLITPRADGVRGRRRVPWGPGLSTQPEAEFPTQPEARSGSATMQQGRNWLHWPGRGLHWPGRGLFTKDAMRDVIKPHQMILSMPELECATGHALAIYGDFQQYLSNYPLQTYYAAIDKFTGVSEADVLWAVWRSSAFKPAHYVALDHAHHKIIVSVRGTFDKFDTITDLVARPVTHDFGVPGMLGLVHSGILQAAQATLDSIRDVLHQAIAKEPEYDILITGHSMGGGTAALMAMLLRHDMRWPTQQRQRIRAVVLAPAAILSKNLAWACQSYVASIVYNWDVVPRVDINSVARYLTQVASSSPLRRAMLSVYHAISRLGRGASSQATATTATAAAAMTVTDDVGDTATAAAAADEMADVKVVAAAAAAATGVNEVVDAAVVAETQAELLQEGTSGNTASSTGSMKQESSLQSGIVVASHPTAEEQLSFEVEAVSDGVSAQGQCAGPEQMQHETVSGASGFDSTSQVIEGVELGDEQHAAAADTEQLQAPDLREQQQIKEGSQQEQGCHLREQQQPEKQAQQGEQQQPTTAVLEPHQSQNGVTKHITPHQQDRSVMPATVMQPTQQSIVNSEAAQAVESVIHDSRTSVRSISTLNLKASFRRRLERYRSNSLRTDAKLDASVRAAVEAVHALKPHVTHSSAAAGLVHKQPDNRQALHQEQQTVTQVECSEQEAALQHALAALQDLLNPDHHSSIATDVNTMNEDAVSIPMQLHSGPHTDDAQQPSILPQPLQSQHVQPPQLQQSPHFQSQQAQVAAGEATKLVTSALGQLRQLRLQQSCRLAASMRIKPGQGRVGYNTAVQQAQQGESQQLQSPEQQQFQQKEAWLQEQINTHLDEALAVMHKAISSTAAQDVKQAQTGGVGESPVQPATDPLPASSFEIPSNVTAQQVPSDRPIESSINGRKATTAVPAGLCSGSTESVSAGETTDVLLPLGNAHESLGMTVGTGKPNADRSTTNSKASGDVTTNDRKSDSKSERTSGAKSESKNESTSMDSKVLLQPLQAPGSIFWLLRDTRLKHKRVPLAGGKGVFKGLARMLSSGKAPPPDAMPPAEEASPKDQGNFMASLAPGLEVTEEEADTPQSGGSSSGSTKGQQELPVVLLEADASWFTDMLVSFKALNDHTPVSYHKALTQLIKQHKQKHRWPLGLARPRPSSEQER